MPHRQALAADCFEWLLCFEVSMVEQEEVGSAAISSSKSGANEGAPKPITLLIVSDPDVGSTVQGKALLTRPGWTESEEINGDRTWRHNVAAVHIWWYHEKLLFADDLDLLYEKETKFPIREVLFLSRHSAASGQPSLTLHCIGVPAGLPVGGVGDYGGKNGYAVPPSPRFSALFQELGRIAKEHGLTGEFDITVETTHHGPILKTPSLFIEIGSTESHWIREDAAEVWADVLGNVLGLGDSRSSKSTSDKTDTTNSSTSVFKSPDSLPAESNYSNNLPSESNPTTSATSNENPQNQYGDWFALSDVERSATLVMVGLGGGHYAPRHSDVVRKTSCWMGHLLAGYALPMEKPDDANWDPLTGRLPDGQWRHSIDAAIKATRVGFPGGQIVVHLDKKSFKGWQRQAIRRHLETHSIRIVRTAGFSVE
jgi:D-aminoacyl-tRNA deacylase